MVDDLVFEEEMISIVQGESETESGDTVKVAEKAIEKDV